MDTNITEYDGALSHDNMFQTPPLDEVEVIESQPGSPGRKPSKTSSRNSSPPSNQGQSSDSDADSESEKTKKSKQKRRKTRRGRRNDRKWRRSVSFSADSSDSDSVTSLRSDIEEIGTLGKSYSSALKKLEKLTDHLNDRIERLEKLKDRIHRLEHMKEKPKSASAESESSGTQSASSKSIITKKGTKKTQRDPFELKIQFFSPEAPSSLYNAVVYPFIRVQPRREYKLTPHPQLPSPPPNTKSTQQQKSNAPTHNAFREIHIESPVMKRYFDEIASKARVSTVAVRDPVRARAVPPPPPGGGQYIVRSRNNHRRRTTRRGRDYSSTPTGSSDSEQEDRDNMLRFSSPFRWLIQHRDLFESKAKELEK